MNLIFRILFFSALGVITVLAFLPNYSGLPEIVSISDLLNHAAAFALLFCLYSYAFESSSRHIFLLLLVYAFFIEFVQAFLPTRSASLTDIAADLFGMLLGWVIVKGLRRLPQGGKGA